MSETGSRVAAHLAVIVPCYNAGPRIVPVIESILRVHDCVFVVDDGSTDGAVAGLSPLPVQVVSLPQNQGKGFALLRGFQAALEDPAIDCVATLDADGQHDPHELPHLYSAFTAHNADLLIGSRTFSGRHVPFRSRLGNVATSILTKALLGVRLPDTQSGYRLHSRRLLEAVLRDVPGGRYETEMEILVLAVKREFTVVPEPIATIYENENASSHFNPLRDSWRVYRKLFMTSLRQRK